jgi:hypothetical protein
VNCDCISICLRCSGDNGGCAEDIIYRMRWTYAASGAQCAEAILNTLTDWR